MKPMWEEIEKENPGLNTEYYDADDNPEFLKEYEVGDIPEFIFLDKDGNEFHRLRGAQNKGDLEKFVKDNLDK